MNKWSKVVVCLLVAAVFLVPLFTVEISSTNGERFEERNDVDPRLINKVGVTGEVDVPVYEVGDSWVYEFEISNYNYDSDGRIYFVYNRSHTSTVTVIDDSGDFYTFEETTENVKGHFRWLDTKIRFTPFTQVTFNYKRRKTDLAESEWDIEVEGFVFWLKGSINFPIPAQIYWRQDVVNTPPRLDLPFPLIAGINGTIPAYGSHRTSNCFLYWGLMPLWQGESDFDRESSDYTCEMASITTPAGTYEAYNVSAEGFWGDQAHDYYRYYYVPELGNSAKLIEHKDWDSNGKTWYDEEWSLISTTYVP